MDPEILRYLKGLFVGLATLLAILSPFVLLAVALVAADLKGKKTPAPAITDRPSRLHRVRDFLVWIWSVSVSGAAFFKEHVIPRPAEEPALRELPETPAFRFAIRHRCIKSRNRRIFVADHSDGKSVGTLIVGSTNRQRIPLGELETSPESDLAFVERSNNVRHTPQVSPCANALLRTSLTSHE